MRSKIPLRTEGDVADLHRRIMGTEQPMLKDELSEEYKGLLEGKGR